MVSQMASSVHMVDTLSDISLGTDSTRAQALHNCALDAGYRAQLQEGSRNPGDQEQPFRLLVPSSDREAVRLILREAANRPMDLDVELHD